MRIRYYCDLRTLQCGASHYTQGKIKLERYKMAQLSDAEIQIIGRAGASPPSRTTGPRCL